MKPKKNEFCYSFKRWDISPDSKKTFKKFVLEAIETCKDDLVNFDGMDAVYFPEDSPIRKFSLEKQVLLLDRLTDAVTGKPFVGMSSTSDYVLEELLYRAVTSHVERSLDMEDECLYAKESAKQIREVYASNTPKEMVDEEDISGWAKDYLWQDIDWLSFPVDSKEYEKTYLNDKPHKGKVKDLPIFDI